MPTRSESSTWHLWADTGGTFTDALAIDPEGGWHRAKVLSSSALRARVLTRIDDHTLGYQASWSGATGGLPDDFARDARLVWLERDGVSSEIRHSTAARLTTGGSLPLDLRPGEAIELRFSDEAPILAARLICGAAAVQELPPLALRLATTRGTNALLERRGARTALFITRGFADLLLIGDQQRPDLFALAIDRPPPLYQEVVEVDERLNADGTVLEPLVLDGLDRRCDELLRQGIDSAAVALLHSYRRDDHEQRLGRHLERCGFAHVSLSSALAPMIKILPRAQTAVVNAYLSPIVERYLDRVGGAVSGGSLHVMTSAGGLVRAASFEAKDSLLSGPAGGVVGAVLSARECGEERLIAFDMGGTSTDVARFDGDHEYVFEHRVGDALVAAPALAIESVAAGGGSLCWHDGAQLKVGPHSAGADPGPACYGAGGPLSLTDVNLLLGRLDPSRFGIPIDLAAAASAFDALAGELQRPAGSIERETLLAGFLAIADERMADAIRRISVRQGYDPRDYTLVAFGGAGGQHACAVATLLGVRRVLMPRDAGLLSALGLGAAVIERFAHRPVLKGFAEVGHELERWLDELAAEASAAVAAEGVAVSEIEIRQRLIFLRFAGQERALEIPFDGTDPRDAFAQRYRAIYGYRPQQLPIEVEALRVVASSRPGKGAAGGRSRAGEARDGDGEGTARSFLGGAWRRVPTYSTATLRPEARLEGPALVFDDHATLVVEDGWRGRVMGSGAIRLDAHRS